MLCRLFSSCGEWGLMSSCDGFSCCGTRALGHTGVSFVVHGLSSCSSQAQQSRRMGLAAPRHVGSFRIKPMSAALVGGFFTTEPPGKPELVFLPLVTYEGTEYVGGFVTGSQNYFMAEQGLNTTEPASFFHLNLHAPSPPLHTSPSVPQPQSHRD